MTSVSNWFTSRISKLVAKHKLFLNQIKLRNGISVIITNYHWNNWKLSFLNPFILIKIIVGFHEYVHLS